jgi:hypothetical protein
MKNNEEKKIALKLLNKYADSYGLLEEENRQLRAEILDMKINLKINKEIIQGFFQLNSFEDKSTFYHTKLKEEVISLTMKIDKLLLEKEDLKLKVNQLFLKKI